MKTPTLASPPRGFALVITLLLMIILTVVAVGLLSLSTISIRTSGQAQAMATARGNARLALMMALGDLQKTIGPDRAVTANSAILVDTKKFNTTGVWESWWDFDPNSSPTPDYVAQKKDRFRRWLVSSPNPTDTQERDFAITPWTGQQITLVGGGSLGTGNTGPAQAVAGLVPVTAGKSKGAYAWHVADESIKARVNLYRDPTKNSTLAEKRALLAGHRPDPSVIEKDNIKLDFLPTDTVSGNGTAENNFEKATKVSQKITNLGQLDLVNTGGGSSTNNAEKIKPFRNDITPYSLGVLTDVRHGGLKQDLSSVFEMSDRNSINLPPEFSGKKLYQSTLGLSGDSDPLWNTIAGYYNSFRSIETPDEKPTLELPAAMALSIKKEVPAQFSPGPVIVKVDTIFSLVAHPVSDIGWWGNVAVPTNYDYFVSLLYTPVVTLHNPYNVDISFQKLSVNFKNVPVAFNFMFQAGGTGPFVSQSVIPGTFESINTMTRSDKRDEKEFEMTIANWTDTKTLTPNSSIKKPIVMKPGETLICGLSKDDSVSFNSPGEDMFDWDNNGKTMNNKALPTFTPGLGFELNGLAISNLRQQPDTGAPGGSGKDWCTFLLLRDSQNKGRDKFYVDFKAQHPYWYPDWDSNNPSTAKRGAVNRTFEVTTKLQASANGQLTDYTRLQFDYNNGSGSTDWSNADIMLDKFFKNRTYTYPPSKDLTGSELSGPPNVTYAKQFSYQQPFAIFSAYARTTNGGVDETGKRIEKSGSISGNNTFRDGRLAGKPFLFHNPSIADMKIDLANQKLGAQAYELNLQPFVSKNDYSNTTDIEGNRVPVLTANTTTRGIKSGSYFEIPTGPLQTIADFRRSNALNSSFLPQFVQPVGNSLLHPLMSSDKVIETNSSIQREDMLDQSVLANHALYDRFYFSTFSTRNKKSPSVAFDQFINLLDPTSTKSNTSSLLTQSFTPYLPAGKTATSAKAELFSGSKPSSDAYRKAAEYQMIQGPFNVNSTNITAWKAVLAAMSKSEVDTFWSKSDKCTTTHATSNNDKIPIFGMSLLNGNGSNSSFNTNNIDNLKTNLWNGYRELTPGELDTLATKIVEQVRSRGPFLSMSEFVNRQIGVESDLSLRGALESAITDSGINDGFFKDYVTSLSNSNFTGPEFSKLYNYKTLAATTGPEDLSSPGSRSKANPAAGAPGWVSQGDLLRILEPAATVRSDTFVIRVYGEAKDGSGNMVRAYAEAVVQRVPEYVDPVDRPSLNAYDQTIPINVTSTASIINKAFGRRINVVSFRWLSGNEI
jgi:type II secretory pathway pseudopilin PulG